MTQITSKSRRKFLGQASCALLGSSTYLSSALQLGMINTAAARDFTSGTNDYKAIVCILLAGGIDSFNVLVPTENSEYNEYLQTRSSLALGTNELLDLNYNDNGRTFAVNHGLSEVQTLFNQSKLSFISNIGTLIEPIANISQYNSGNKKIPLGLYSHNDQIMQWQTSVPQSRSAYGVGGRMEEMLNDSFGIPEISMNISLDGKNRFQAGNSITEFAINNNSMPDNLGITGIPNYQSNEGFLNSSKDQVIKNMADFNYSNIFKNTYGKNVKDALENINHFSKALSKSTVINQPFSEAGLSQDLKMVAQIINAQSFLGSNRQIFFINFGGWDHHDKVKEKQNAMLPILSKAISEFCAALEEINHFNNVTTFTISDFARTLTSNGNGSDHAWGGNQLIMGGAIKGKHIFGDYPSLRIDNNPLNVNERGRIIPQISVDELYADLALWFGVSPNDLSYILPNIGNFYSHSNSNPNGPLNIFS